MRRESKETRCTPPQGDDDQRVRYERTNPLNILTELDLAGIVARARTLDERLGGDGIGATGGADEALVDRRLEAWREALGGRERFHKRLAWDGLDLEAARHALGPVGLPEGAPLPEWARHLARALRLPFPERREASVPASDASWPEGLGFLEAEDPLAFEELLAPFVLAAREELAVRLAGRERLLSDEARNALERGLLQNLVSEAAEALFARFEALRVRKQSSSWDRLFSLVEDPDSRSFYLEFVRGMGEGGLARFFQEYPVLARRLGTTSALWVEANAEFLGRLGADMPDLERVFGGGEALGEVVGLRPSLSDPHRGGRGVVALALSSGRKLVYKPKDMGMEAAYFRLLEWLNERDAPLPFKVLEVLDRSTHGWVEFAEQVPCRDENEARRYHERAGMLLCLFYALEVTDCHYENIVASGEHPVLIDAETLMHHRARGPIPFDGEDAYALAGDQFGRSVLRTGLLPRWELAEDERTAYHVSGLGQVDEDERPIMRALRWTWVNTDRMARMMAPVKPPARENVPRMEDGSPIRLEDHGQLVVAGFRRMYRFLLVHREELVRGPLRRVGHEPVRFVFRATRVYMVLLRQLRDPRFLRDGMDRSIHLEKLGRAQVPPREALVASPEERPVFWPVFEAERCAMELGDVPFFTASPGKNALSISPGEEVEGCFEEPSLERVIGLLASLDEEDMERQVAFIEGSLYAHLARETSVSSYDPRPVSDEAPDERAAPDGEAFVAPALALAEEIRRRAILAGDGSATWISPQFLVRSERYQLQPMNHELYGGTSGVALFLAAAEGFAPEKGYGELALAALKTPRRMLDRWPKRLAEGAIIGGASGLGSLVYALAGVGRLLGDRTLLTDARRVADLITDDRIAADGALDVIAGSAGAILSLLALQECEPDAGVLSRTVLCGEHLLEERTESRAGPRAWAIATGVMNTGFSHGAAGIAYALLRLHGHTGDARLLEAAREAITYEESEYSPEMGNWADYGEKDDEARYPWQWCRGAPGIGLARLGGLPVLDDEQVRADVEIALRGTQQVGVGGVDHPCCGNMGRAELLLSAGETLARPELTSAARSVAWRIAAHAEDAGGFVLHPMLPRQVDSPGFFQGTSGIGYGLLRMARPDRLPSVLMWK